MIQAITVAVWIRGFITPIDAGLFILMQLLGSFSGAMLAWIITDEIPFIVPAAHHGDSHVPQGRCLLAEIIYSFAICLVVINVATTESQRGNFCMFHCSVIFTMLSIRWPLSFVFLTDSLWSEYWNDSGFWISFSSTNQWRLLQSRTGHCIVGDSYIQRWRHYTVHLVCPLLIHLF